MNAMRKSYLVLGAIGMAAATLAAASVTAPAESPGAAETLRPATASDMAALPQLDVEAVANPVPAAVCFHPDAPQRLVGHVQRQLNELWDTNGDYNAVASWGAGGGNPVSLTWSIPADGLNIPSGIGEPAGPNNINASLQQIFGTVEAGKDRIRNVFARWGELTGITYTEVSDDNATWGFPGSATRGDIRIAMKSFGFQGVLAYNSFPEFGDMVMNRNHLGDFAFSFANHRFFRNTVAHEHGHGVGLAHVCPINESRLLEPFLSIDFDMVQHDEIRGGQRNYGDDFENNDFASQANDLGTVPLFAQLFNLSLDKSSDLDFYKFTVDPGQQVTITVTPTGHTYADWDQNQQTGQCFTSGPTVNSLTMQNPEIVLLASNGVNVLATQDSAAAGVPEILQDFTLPSGGPFFIRVRGSSGVNDVQTYQIRLDVEPSQNVMIELVDASIIFGEQVEGGVFRLNTSNDSYWVVNSIFGFSAQEPNIAQVVVGAESSHTALSDLDATIELRLDNPGGAGTFQLKRWATGNFETVHTYSIGTAEMTFNFDVPDQNAYLRPSDGRIEAQVKHTVVATFSASGFRQFFDLLQYDGTPQ